MASSYCTVTMYKAEGLRKLGRNFVINAIGTYLNNNCTGDLAVSYSSVSMTRIGLNMSFKLPVSQEYSFSGTFYNYSKVEYRIGSSVGTYYCFIDSITQVAPMTALISMTIDTLNTFYDSTVFTDKCHIVRQHKDRYTLSDGVYRQVIDRYPEGLEVSLYNTATAAILPDSGKSQRWYLSYSTKNDLTSSNITNPVSVKIIPEDSIAISHTDSNILSVSVLTEGKHYFVFSNENSGGFFSEFSTRVLGNDLPSSANSIMAIFEIYVENSLVKIKFYSAAKSDSTLSLEYSSSVSSLTANGISKIRVISDANSGGCLNYEYAVQVTEGYLSVGSSPTLTKFSDYDRSDSKLMKIIELPYAPFTEIWSSGYLTVPSGFKVRDGYVYAESTDTEFEDTISASYDALAFSVIGTAPAASSVYNDRNIFDPKIHHSDFFCVKFIYDSYFTQFRLEDMIPYSASVATEPRLRIVFKPTNTINSKFLFRMYPSDNYSYKGDSDYPLTIIAARNNEKTIFTNDYLNYIRTGYNYDLKKNSASITASILSSAVSIGGGLLSAATANPVGAAIGIGAAASGIGSAISVINSAYQNDTSMKSKLQTLAFQSTGASGSDDLDLFNGYTPAGNKLDITVYQPRDDVKAMLENLWHYYGYKCNTFEKPDMNSRYWFNYIQGDMVFEKSSYYPGTPSMTSDMEQVFKEKFSNGVTIYHNRAQNSVAKWDLTQELENMEMSVYNQVK